MPVAAVGAALVLALAACAAPQVFATNRPPAPVFDSGDICDPDAPSGGVPDRFEPVAAYLCDPEFTIMPIDPRATPPPLELGPAPHTAPRRTPVSEAPDPAVSPPNPTPRRFEGDLEPLLAALRVPDQPLTDGPCAAVMVFPPEVRLMDERGRWVRPAIPTNACSQPDRGAIDEAFARLTPVD